jgi:hypothetical protein
VTAIHVSPAFGSHLFVIFRKYGSHANFTRKTLVEKIRNAYKKFGGDLKRTLREAVLA